MPNPEPLHCSVAGCDFSTRENTPTWDSMISQLYIHSNSAHHAPAPAAPAQPPAGGGHAAAAATPKLEKLSRPTFTLNMSESKWNFTETRWNHYINQAPNASENTKLLQLQDACDDELRQRIFDTGTYSTLTTTELFLDKMKKLSVITVHKSVHLMNLWRMSQESDEGIRAFVARVTSTADMCGMSVRCGTCQVDISYRDNVVQQIVIHGMRDNDIRLRVLSRNTANELTTLERLVEYIAAEEASITESHNLMTPHNTVGGIKSSSYRKSKFKQPSSQPPPKPILKTPMCKFCGEARHTSANSWEDRQKMCKAFGKKCTSCGVNNHYSKQCQNFLRNRSTAAAVLAEDDSDGTIGSIVAGNGPESAWTNAPNLYPSTTDDLRYPVNTMRGWEQGPVTSVPLPHHVHDAVAGWLPSRPRDSPTLMVSFAVDRPAYSALGLNLPRFRNSGHNPGRTCSKLAVADSGAQLTVIPKTLLDDMNVKGDSIFPVSTGVNGASNAPILVDGGILLTVTAKNNKTGAVKTSHQLAYVSQHINVPYLSQNACIDLGLLPPNFPEVGSCDQPSPHFIQSLTSASPTKCSNSGVPMTGDQQDHPCSCPRREPPPQSPPVLPCAPTEENLHILKQYILDRYRSSAFNCCEHQPLKLMDSAPPLRIFIDEDATPVAIHTPSKVPLHWQDAVKRGLDRDVNLGVLEKVGVNEPVTWTSRMVITPKPDGSPRRVVDFTALNKHAPRQTHHTESPWSIVSSIPANKVKTTLDCWHGYHSVPVDPRDRHLLTFLTPWGRYRHRTCPQGLLSAGDGYTHRRTDLLEEDFSEDSKTCVDDSMIYNDSIEENFFRVCQFLEKSARGGCTFNPKKFQFGCREVTFLGFLVTDTGIKPTPQFVENIASFPTPANITDVRSWFGAINQISFSFATAPVMEPFRHLLKSKVPFHWTPELQTAFDESKQEILRQCEKGVRLFDPNLPTALATDWSKSGVGYWLTQKHCSCQATVPGCCDSGWQTVYCGSRFCSPAESRYHPIEGEALATINGLEKCKFFILGIKNLVLCLDHKPLLAIFGKQDKIEDIQNPRLLNFKLKSMQYKFQVTHVPGKKNVIPDMLSRRSDSPVTKDSKEFTVTASYSSSLSPPAWVSPPTIGAMTTDQEELLQGHIIASLASINAPLSADNQGVISWQKLEAACLTDDDYKLLHTTIENGVSDDVKAWDQKITDFFPHRHSLVTVGPVVMLYDRPVIPRSLQQAVMEHLHVGHASASSMFERASTSLYWPHFRTDLINFRASCQQCSRYAPSNPAMPPVLPTEPSYPFESICADFFSLGTKTYLALVDRYSNWLTILKFSKDTTENWITALRQFITTFGIPVTITTDGAKVFTSKAFEDFCCKWGIIHRVSTAYNPQANKRSELAVKHAKKMIRGNTSQTGSLDTDNLVKALLIHRNTPCPISGLSPSQIVFGRQVRDPLPLQPNKFFPRQEWRQAAEAREQSLAKRRFTAQEKLSKGTRDLPPLSPGDHVFIQDQHGNTPKQWSKTGVVIEAGPYHSYHVSVDGSRTITKRNRKYLRKFTPTPVSPPVTKPPMSPMPLPEPHLQPAVPKPPVVLEPQQPEEEPAPPPVPLQPLPDSPPRLPPMMLRRDHQGQWSVPNTPPRLPPMTLRRNGDGGQWSVAPPVTMSPIQLSPSGVPLQSAPMMMMSPYQIPPSPTAFMYPLSFSWPPHYQQ